MTLRKIKQKLQSKGFLLPTVIIVVFAISILSIAALRVVTSTSVDLNNQNYTIYRQTGCRFWSESGDEVYCRWYGLMVNAINTRN